MSQKKVDEYKRQKANREQIMKKEKRARVLGRSVAVLVLVAIVGWLGYSVYGQVERAQEAKVTETVMDATAIDDYLSGLSSEAE